jgi:VanZ family protein
LASLIVAAAPFMGEVRDFLLARFPQSFVRGLGLAFVAPLAVALALAVGRIREHLLARYAGLAASLALMALLLFALGTGQAQVDAVERIHVLEYGLLALLFYRALSPLGDLRALAYPVLATALAGIADEWVQWLVPTRVGDVRDVALNAGAGLAGLIFALSLSPPAASARRLSRPALARTLGVLAAVVLAFATFFRAAHLGFWIEDSEAGRFRSTFTRDEVLAAAEDRRQRWAGRPPPASRPLSREDFFLTEATWHVAQRNASLAQGNLYVAGKENRILERYFAPALDLRSAGGGALYRLSEEQRDEVEKGAARHPERRYESRVLADRLMAGFSPGSYWAGIAALVASFLALAWILRRRPGASVCAPGPA